MQKRFQYSIMHYHVIFIQNEEAMKNLYFYCSELGNIYAKQSHYKRNFI